MKKQRCALFTVCVLICMLFCSCSNQGGTFSDSSKGNTVATVITNDGESKRMTAKDLVDLKESNPVAFENKYFQAKVTVIGKVEKIHGRTTLDGHYMSAYLELEDGWIIDAYASDVADLAVGDTVKAVGNIFSISLTDEVRIYKANGHETVITKM